jgi:hypothetical protein
MQRKPDIKWRTTDTEKLQHEINRFNAKIERVKRSHPEWENFLPKRIDKNEFKSNIKTRQDFNRELKSLDRFSQRGIEKPITSKTGNTVTKWEKKEAGYKVAQINRNRKAQRDFYNIERPNMQMGTRKQNELKPKKFDFDKIKKGDEWEKFKATLEKQISANYNFEKLEQYKKNYLESIQNNLGYSGDELYNFISRIPADILYNHYWDDDELLKIQFTYDPLPADTINDSVLEHWKNALGLENGEDYDDYLARIEEEQ